MRLSYTDFAYQFVDSYKKRELKDSKLKEIACRKTERRFKSGDYVGETQKAVIIGYWLCRSQYALLIQFE